MTISCPACRIENPETHKFCSQCGQELAVVCDQCGASCSLTANFCGECGNQLPKAKASKSQLVTSRAGQEGELKLVTVLFADICGSTTLVEHMDAETAAQHIRPVIELMSKAVRRYDGTVNKHQGDGIMALFGAPIAHEDHAIRAAFAALDMLDAIAGTVSIGLQIRVGLNTGEVLVRFTDNDLSIDYDAIGQTVHVAARMEQLASPGTAFISPATRRLVLGSVDVQSVGSRPIKGLTEPLEVFKLSGKRPDVTSWSMRSARGLTKFVGRTAEVEFLGSAVEDVRGGLGTLAAIIGEPGQGKSRLVHEFVQHDLNDGYTVLRADCAAHGTATSYLLFKKLLQDCFRVGALEEPSQVAARVEHDVTALGENLTTIVPALQSVLEVPVADKAWHDLDTRLRRRRIIDGIKSLCHAKARTNPLVIVFEDLHWIDSESQAVLDGLIDSIEAQPVAILATFRPEYQHSWSGKGYYRGLRLKPIGSEPATEILDELIGQSSALDALKELLVERAGGTPLFLEETVRDLHETGFLEGQLGEYRLARPIEELRVPDSVHAVIASRIDRLTPGLKDVLQMASVIGRVVPLKQLEKLAKSAEGGLAESMAELTTSEFLFQAASLEAEYVFKHALIELVAYEMMLKERRRGLHNALVGIIESEHSDRLDEHLETLGHHSIEAEDWQRAYDYNLKAARKSHARSAYRLAIDYFETAADALEKLPDSTDTTRNKIDVNLEMRTALWPLGDHHHLYHRIGNARKLAENSGEINRLATVHSYLTAHYWQDGQHKLAIEHGLEAIRMAETVGDSSTLITSKLHLGLAYLSRGQYQESTELHREVAETFSGAEATLRAGMAGFPAAFSRGYLARGLAELGDRENFEKWAREGLEIAELTNSAITRVVVTNEVALARLRFGLVESALSLMEPNLTLCHDADVGLMKSISTAILGHTLALNGDLNRAASLLEEAVLPDMQRMSPQGTAFPRVWLAECYLELDREMDAEASAKLALDQAIRNGEEGHHAWALRLLGLIESKRSEANDLAIKHFNTAKDIASAHFMVPLVNECEQQLEVAASN